jgi:1-acyl-sn-glycerol-3-phosphate acyltransferase
MGQVIRQIVDSSESHRAHRLTLGSAQRLVGRPAGRLTAGILGTGELQTGREPRLLPYTATALAVRPVFRSAFRLKVVSPERIPARGPLVVVANHESNVDGFVLISVFTERRLRFLSAAHLFERPGVGLYLRAIGALPVEEQAANVASFKKALAILRGGGTVAVFPQGGIARDEIQGGAAYLALKANATLLPLHIAGTGGAFPPGRSWPSLTPITVRVGRPVAAVEIANGSASTRAAVAEGTRLVGRLLAETRVRPSTSRLHG